MTEALRQGAENPEFGAERALPRPEERIHVVERRSALERRAAQAGSALGRAAAALRDIQDKLAQGGEGGPAERVRVMADRGRARAQELSEAASSRAQEWISILRERSLELKDRAQERWAYLRQERPLHVAIAAGAVGLLVGVGLRIRRAQNAKR